MKIKNIDNLTLAECQEYMATNPNGENAQEVLERMEHLLKFKKEKQQEYSARKIHDFNTEFNRYYATQRYEEAFVICLQYMNDADDKATIIEKAGLVIPKLKNRILLPATVSVSYDWLIDQLVLNGYNNMKYDGTTIKWKSSTVKLSINNSRTRITSKCRINLFFRFVIFIVLCIITVAIISFLCNVIGPEIFSPYSDWSENWEYYHDYHYDEMLVLGIGVAIIFFIIWISTYAKILNQHKKLLRRIAQITIDYISKYKYL